MLETLRLDIAQVSLSFGIGNKKSANDTGYTCARWHSRVNEFIQLIAKVTNLMCMFCCTYSSGHFYLQSPVASPVVFALDFEATPSEYLVYEGVFTDVAVGRLMTGESREISMLLCFLSCGRYEICAQVRGVDSPETDGRLAKTFTTVIVESDVEMS